MIARGCSRGRQACRRLGLILVCLVSLNGCGGDGSAPTPTTPSPAPSAPAPVADGTLNVVLGRPTDRSVAVSVLASAGVEVYVDPAVGGDPFPADTFL